MNEIFEQDIDTWALSGFLARLEAGSMEISMIRTKLPSQLGMGSISLHLKIYFPWGLGLI